MVFGFFFFNYDKILFCLKKILFNACSSFFWPHTPSFFHSNLIEELLDWNPRYCHSLQCNHWVWLPHDFWSNNHQDGYLKIPKARGGVGACIFDDNCNGKIKKKIELKIFNNFQYPHLRLVWDENLKLFRVEVKEWYFVSKIVLTYSEKKMFQWLRKPS